MRNPLFATFGALAVVTTASAQRLIAYDPFAGLLAETQQPSAIFPGPSPPLPVYPSAPALPPPLPGVPAAGDATTNTITGVTWFTNGVVLASMPTPSFPPAGPIVPPFAIAPGVLAAIGGPATGIALDPVLGIMWLTAAPGMVIGVAPIPGTPVVMPPFFPGFAMAPTAGLEWDGITGTLLSVDIAGTVYRYFPGGAPFGPPLVPIGLPPGPVGDVAIDKSGVLNVALLRPIYVSAGPMVMDVTFPSPALPHGVGLAGGLAYLARPASSPPVGACPCGPLTPVWSTSGPMTAGNAGFAIGLGGLPPGSLALFALDFAFNPVFPMINVSGCPLGLVVPSGTMVTALGFANAVGVATFPLPLFAPPGFGPIYEQSFTLCPFDLAGFTVAPLLQLAAGGT